MKIQLSIFCSLLVALVVTLTSCEKTIECESPCMQACEFEPMPIWCGTGAVARYYFNKATGQCEEYATHQPDQDNSFETLEDCQACRCNQYDLQN